MVVGKVEASSKNVAQKEDENLLSPAQQPIQPGQKEAMKSTFDQQKKQLIVKTENFIQLAMTKSIDEENRKIKSDLRKRQQNEYLEKEFEIMAERDDEFSESETTVRKDDKESEMNMNIGGTINS